MEVLLRKVSNGHIVYSPLHKAFVSLSSETSLPFNAEEYADLMGNIHHPPSLTFTFVFRDNF